jgi:hypothetical protein
MSELYAKFDLTGSFTLGKVVFFPISGSLGAQTIPIHDLPWEKSSRMNLVNFLVVDRFLFSNPVRFK